MLGQDVLWNSFNIENLGEHHDVHLMTHVYVLTEAVENFRGMCFTMHFVTNIRTVRLLHNGNNIQGKSYHKKEQPMEIHRFKPLTP